jgi:hypothetical protein
MQNTGHYFGTQQEYARMFEMIFGAHTSQIVHTAALYSLSEHLAEGRNTPTEIAAVESLHVDATFRLMRACAAIGLMTYDFFANPLPPADLFLLKLILHDWNDDAGLAILRSCRRSISAGGRILVVEQLIDEIGTPGFTPCSI